MKAGRHAAAVKALRKSLDLQPGDWMPSYLLAEVQRQMGHFAEAIEAFQSVACHASDTTAVLLSLAETHLAHGRTELTTGYLSRASISFLSAITVSLDLARSSPAFRRLALKTTVDAFIAMSDFSDIACNDMSAINALLELIGSGADERLEGIITFPLQPPDEGMTGNFALKLSVALSSFRITLFTKNEAGMGTAWYDLALALKKVASTALSKSVREKAQRQANNAARQALLLEPGKPAFWNLFGSINFVSRPAIAQHAYVRALECNSKV